MLAAVCVCALGPIVGSFLATEVRRRSGQTALIGPASKCESCAYRLAASDLVPVVSFVVCRGRCRHCRAAIHPEHLLYELGGGLICATSLLAGPRAFEGALFGLLLLAAAAIDIRTLRIPDPVNIAIAIGGAIVGRLHQDPLLLRLSAALACFALLSLCAWRYERIHGRTGLGRGDVKMFSAASLWLPSLLVPWAVLIASGAALAFALAIRGQQKAVLPFAPFIGLGCWTVWLLASSYRFGGPLL